MQVFYLLLLLFWLISIPLNSRLYLSQQISGINFSARLLLALSFILISLINTIDFGPLETLVMGAGVLTFVASIGIFLFEGIKRRNY
jgi:hypothetical protein